MAVVVDTSVIVELERRKPFDPAQLDLLAGDTVMLASITISELLAGIHRSNSPERRQRRERYIEAIIEQYTVVPFDLSVARVHARLGAELATIGQLIGAHDLMIAATAHAHAAAVLTHNVRDFGRVPGLIVREVVD